MEGERCCGCNEEIRDGQDFVRFKIFGQDQWNAYHNGRHNGKTCWDKYLAEHETIQSIEYNQFKSAR